VFGLRYHVASLAAVFLALAVGILLGVAISGKVSEAEQSFEGRQKQELQDDLDAANARADAAEERGAAAQELVERAYPALMENRLDDLDVALVFLGPVDGNVRSEVEDALSDAGAGAPAFVVALALPLEPDELRGTLEGDEQLAAYADDGGDFGSLGRELGEEVVVGGDTPLWNTLQSVLVEEKVGSFSPEVDGAVVVYSWRPEPEQDGQEVAPEVESTLSLTEGLVRGVDASDVPVVGVTASGQPTDLIELYRDQGISSVDSVDTAAGRIALALLLAGGEPGHYGIKDSATDGVTPLVSQIPSE
jgi:Copper transport outer membrane protein, MctB